MSYFSGHRNNFLASCLLGLCQSTLTGLRAYHVCVCVCVCVGGGGGGGEGGMGAVAKPPPDLTHHISTIRFLVRVLPT